MDVIEHIAEHDRRAFMRAYFAAKGIRIEHVRLSDGSYAARKVRR